VFRFEGGRLFDRESFIFDSGEPESDAEEFLIGYYTLRRDIPKNIALCDGLGDLENLTRWLSEKKGSRVYVTVPQRGEQAKLVQMCRSNAAEALAQQKGATVREYSVLEELRETLGLDKLPEYIESYDISNLAGTENVAGMIVYKNGRPLKSAYRKFKIKGFEGQDDYASMAEVITRRFEEYFKAEKADEGFGRLPDLILLDGGRGQVTAVRGVLERMGLDIPLFGMVKDQKHRTRAIATNGGEIAVREKQAAFNLLTRIQDEVHRFAITYMKTRHRKTSYALTLTQVPGIGEKKAQKLLLTYKTRAQLKAATPEQLAKTAGVRRETAEQLYTLIQELPDS
ncbi:MAG: excinuclease ABC subunit UvrC, partial [Ruminococcus sp.]|nr:excinuclease ABC subunit UvrC [Ruminococcus sp.]